jgi:phytoene dehydrogenase-like protein
MDGHGAPCGVVVIGGGMAGLSAACYLGWAGVPVTL